MPGKFWSPIWSAITVAFLCCNVFAIFYGQTKLEQPLCVLSLVSFVFCVGPHVRAFIIAIHGDNGLGGTIVIVALLAALVSLGAGLVLSKPEDRAALLNSLGAGLIGFVTGVTFRRVPQAPKGPPLP